MTSHSRKENWIAILTGTFLVAQGVYFLQVGSLLTGGTAGLALLLSQFFPFTFGVVYFSINLPFYILGWKRFGKSFALSSAISGALVSLFADHLSHLIAVSTIHPAYCAIAGGLLMGLGMLILFRHHSSLGGFNVLCLYIQERWGISVGKTQLAIDATILLSSWILFDSSIILWSILGVAALNMVLAMNHKPNRYGVSFS